MAVTSAVPSIGAEGATAPKELTDGCVTLLSRKPHQPQLGSLRVYVPRALY